MKVIEVKNILIKNFGTLNLSSEYFDDPLKHNFWNVNYVNKDGLSYNRVSETIREDEEIAFCEPCNGPFYRMDLFGVKIPLFTGFDENDVNSWMVNIAVVDDINAYFSYISVYSEYMQLINVFKEENVPFYENLNRDLIYGEHVQLVKTLNGKESSVISRRRS